MNSTLVEKIIELKKKLNAVILVHNYQLAEVQDIADYMGDSLGLSRIAATLEADVILMCGVHFMAETVKILAPDKTVLIPDETAGCPMADMIDAKEVRRLRAKHPEAVFVGYVNTSAEVKAELDICCTSANAVSVIDSLSQEKEIVFLPDKYLGSYAAAQNQRDIILYNGYCPTHLKIMPEDIEAMKKKYPDALVLAHPECSRSLDNVADYMLSTGGMSSFVEKSDRENFIIATEVGMIDRLKKDNPSKNFFPASAKAVCPNMKKTNLQKVLWSLEDIQHEVNVPLDIAEKARGAIEKMVSIT